MDSNNGLLPAISGNWPLLLGVFLLMVSNGLLGTVLTLRGLGIGFNESVVGTIHAAYPAGTLLGCWMAPRLVQSVGHIRVFAALASLASVTALIHLVHDLALIWMLMRLLAGFCFAGLYVVAESWLNGRATNKTRGSLLSLYFMIQAGGIALGQTLLSLAAPGDVFLLVLVSILISLSLVPILISASSSPPYDPPEPVGIIDLFKLSPMGLSGCFFNGIAQGALYVTLAIYGRGIGLENAAIGSLIGLLLLGSMVCQFPLGKLSDMVDRRWVLTLLACIALPVCYLLAERGESYPFILFAGVATLGALVLPVYSICVAHTNDHLSSGQIVAASSTLVMVLGVGMVLGPILGSIFIEYRGPSGLFEFLFFVQICNLSTIAFRLWKGKPREESTMKTVAYSHGVTGNAVRLNPDIESEES